MELFEKVEKEQYSWTVFYLLNDICYDEDKCKIVREDLEGGIYIEREVTSGIGLNIAEENRKFDACKNVLVFTREIELVLLCPDREINLYSAANNGDIEINNIDIIGRYIYVTDKEICSPVYIKGGNPSDNSYFCNFKEYVLTGHTQAKEFTFDYKDGIFTVLYREEDTERVIFKISGARIDLSYPFVFYILKNMRRDSSMYEKRFKVEKIRRKEY